MQQSGGRRRTGERKKESRREVSAAPRSRRGGGGADETLLPVVEGQRCRGDLAAPARRMNHDVVTGEDADMADLGALAGGEEQQVARAWLVNRRQLVILLP